VEDTLKKLKQHLGKNIDGVSDELADVLYWVLLMAHDLKIDLPTALNKKMKKNAAKYPIEKSQGQS
jgi:dCTP diphosphatase